jgi:hypothetical protein
MKRTPMKPGKPIKRTATLIRKPFAIKAWSKPRTPPKPMKSKPRRLSAYEKRWQQAVLSLKYCVLCGKFGVQWAHRNEGKGMSLKVSPEQSAALCPACHYDIDNGNTLSRTDRRSRMDQAILLTHRALIAWGRIPSPPRTSHGQQRDVRLRTGDRIGDAAAERPERGGPLLQAEDRAAAMGGGKELRAAANPEE